MKKVEAFQTSDGKVFSEEQLARDHELRFQLQTSFPRSEAFVTEVLNNKTKLFVVLSEHFRGVGEAVGLNGLHAQAGGSDAESC